METRKTMLFPSLFALVLVLCLTAVRCPYGYGCVCASESLRVNPLAVGDTQAF
ncbi:MAG: hypothetical protein R2874_07820 [Desulfobacterales bacterium]